MHNENKSLHKNLTDSTKSMIETDAENSTGIKKEINKFFYKYEREGKIKYPETSEFKELIQVEKSQKAKCKRECGNIFEEDNTDKYARCNEANQRYNEFEYEISRKKVRILGRDPERNIGNFEAELNKSDQSMKNTKVFVEEDNQMGKPISDIEKHIETPSVRDNPKGMDLLEKHGTFENAIKEFKENLKSQGDAVNTYDTSSDNPAGPSSNPAGPSSNFFTSNPARPHDTFTSDPAGSYDTLESINPDFFNLLLANLLDFLIKVHSTMEKIIEIIDSLNPFG